MNKRVKIVATLGPAVETAAARNSVKTVTGGENLTVEASAKNIAQLIKGRCQRFPFQLLTW